MSPPQEILDEYHATIAEWFTGIPKPPRSFIESRLQNLQGELNDLTEDHSDYENFSTKLQAEIVKAQAIIDNQQYTEDGSEIAYWQLYKTGLHDFILNRKQGA